MAFIESHMNDDAFVVIPPTKLDPRLKLIDDPAKRERVAKLLDVDAKLKPFGLSAPRVFAHLDGNPNADIDGIMTATQLSERTIRTILKSTGPALVDAGYLPLVEATKTGRAHTYQLAPDWRERLDALRPDLATNGMVIARAVHHAGERIRRIDQFLEKNMRDKRRVLDDATRAQYEGIRARAELLKARLTGNTVVSKAEALAVSDELVTVEAQIEQVAAVVVTPIVTPKPLPVMRERVYLGHFAEPNFGRRELVPA